MKESSGVQIPENIRIESLDDHQMRELKQWFNNGTLTVTADEEVKLKAIYAKYPMGAPSFNIWYKQTLRQYFTDKVAPEWTKQQQAVK